MTEKLILDACCGSKMFWFDKNNSSVVFADQRTESYILCDGRALNITPDIEMDFRDMLFEDNTFHHVVFDPPHLENAGEKSWLRLKYGVLGSDWRSDIKKGFAECMRVLKTNGTLIFKWNEDQIKISEIIKVIGQQPLYGHKSGRNSKTIWLAFIKI
jgi:ubiquinone/menaquinone biosynthesis C-methylase UbiE